MQHFTNPDNPKNLPIDLTGVRQIAWEEKSTQKYVTPVARPPHDGKTYTETHGKPSRKK